MKESNSSKLIWLFAGAIVGSVVALGFDEWIKPLFQEKPDIQITATSEQAGVANFKIQNAGNAPASNVAITLWASAPFAARTDILSIEHTGGITDAECEVGLYKARLMGKGKSAVPSTLDTESQALLVQCKKIRPSEAWQGRVEFQGPQAVFGLLAVVKDEKTTENKYAMFSQGAKQ